MRIVLLVEEASCLALCQRSYGSPDNLLCFIGYTENFYNKIKNNTDMCCKGMNYYQKKAYLLSLSDDVFSHKGNVKIPE